MRRLILAALISIATSASADRLEWSVAPGSTSSYGYKWAHATAVDPWGDRFLAIGHFQFSSLPPAAYGFAGQMWVPMDTTGGPYLASDRSSIGALDRARQRFLILEQSSGDTMSSPPLWQLALGPDAWTPLVQAGDVPSFLFGSGLCADSTGDRLLLFGGSSGLAPFDDTNGVWLTPLSSAPSWTRLSPPGSGPAPRAWGVVAFDEVNRQLLVFGGRSGLDYYTDTWSLSLDPIPTWSEITTSRRPPASGSLAGAWDPGTGRVVVFNGEEVWELVAGPSPDWFVRRVPGAQGHPAARGYGRLSADPRMGRLYLHGGSVDYWHRPVLDPNLWVLTRSATTAPTVEAPEVVSYVRDVQRVIPFTIVNPAQASRTFDWTLTADAVIPGLPVSGTATAPAEGLGGFDVSLTVPDGSPLSFGATVRIRAVDDPADSASIGFIITRDRTDAVDPRIPGLRFSGAIPNPSRGLPRFAFELPRPGQVQLDLIDVGGRRVSSWGPHETAAGAHRVSLGASRPLPPGLYFASLTFEGHDLFERVVILR